MYASWQNSGCRKYEESNIKGTDTKLDFWLITLSVPASLFCIQLQSRHFHVFDVNSRRDESCYLTLTSAQTLQLFYQY